MREDQLKPDDEMLSALATELGLMSLVDTSEPAKKKADVAPQPRIQGSSAA